jgi:hypothetical protein
VIIAHHIILTGYAHWLPNDPRGSLSAELRTPALRALGEIHFGRRRDQPSPAALKAFYKAAEGLLRWPVLWFDHAKRQAVGGAFGRLIVREHLTCYACAVLRNHAHLLIRRHRLRHDRIADLLAEASRRALLAAGLAPADHPVWSEDRFVKFKDTPEGVRTAVAYVQGNLRKYRLGVQQWPFVAAYNDWPFHKHLRRR